MPSLTTLPVYQRGMLCDSIIPNYNCSAFPFDPGLKISSVGKVVIEKLQQGVRFLFLETNNLTNNYNSAD